MKSNRYTDEEFGEIINKYYNFAYNMCHRRLGNNYMIDDILSESFRKLYSFLDKSKTEAETKSYIMRTVLNTMKNYVKKEARRRDSLELIDNYKYEIAVNNDPIYEMLDQENVEEIKRSINNLGSKISSTMALFCEGYTIQEIAAAQNIPVKTAYSRVNAGRKQLKEKLECRKTSEEGGMENGRKQKRRSAV